MNRLQLAFQGLSALDPRSPAGIQSPITAVSPQTAEGASMARTTSGGEPLLLAVDLSNTGIKLGLYPRDGKEKDTLRARWRVATVRDKTTDEYAALLMTLCAQAGLRAEDIADVIIASVVPPLTPVFQAAAEQYLKREAFVVSHEMDLGIKLLVDNPWETGADRMISALATHR